MSNSRVYRPSQHRNNVRRQQSTPMNSYTNFLQRLSDRLSNRRREEHPNSDTEYRAFMAAKFPPLEHEPRVHSMLLSAVPLADASKSTYGQAPPPYRSVASIHDDDFGWSSGSSTAESTGGKRRASWTNLMDPVNETYKSKVNAIGTPISSYPRVASSTCSAYSASPPTFISSDPKGSGRAPASFTSGGSLFSDVAKPASYRPNYMMPPAPAGLTSSDIPAGMPGHRASTAASAVSEPSRHRQEPKRDRMDDLRKWWQKPWSKVLCLCLIILLIVAIIVAIVLTNTFALPQHLKMQWLAPDLHRHGNANPNVVNMDVADNQIRLELAGNPPFKSNYVSVLDFTTNKIAIVDSALKSPGGQNIICFLMDLDRDNIKSVEAFQRAARNAEKKRTQNRGWDESWNFIPQVRNEPPTGQFRPDVAECRGARWVELSYINQYQKNQKCTDCFDFCVPQYGIEHDNIRDESSLNIIRRNCFYLYIPEWRGYAYQQPNSNQLPPNWPTGLGGPNSQDRSNGNGGGVIGAIGSGISQLGQQIGQNPAIQQAMGNAESKWIEIKNSIPPQILNSTGEAIQNFRTNVNQWGQQLFGNNNEQNQNRVPGVYNNGNTPTVVPPAPQPHQVGGFPSSLSFSGQSPSNQYNYNGQSPPGLFPSNVQSPYQNQQQGRTSDSFNGLGNLRNPQLPNQYANNQPQPSSWQQGPQSNNWGPQQPPSPVQQQFGLDLSAQRNQQQASPQFNGNNQQQQQSSSNQQGWVNVAG
ncbi:hypothetical protein M3Y94_00190800 [Aphelenchoides besseyi]|nr:hypothetical protein M3Y94_00190800 [Aphelenchoides besseyi]KAI6236795.1 hypothetical protein M3Y95_00196400 [Aphelenchoides besseyi]